PGLGELGWDLPALGSGDGQATGPSAGPRPALRPRRRATGLFRRPAGRRLGGGLWRRLSPAAPPMDRGPAAPGWIPGQRRRGHGPAGPPVGLGRIRRRPSLGLVRRPRGCPLAPGRKRGRPVSPPGRQLDHLWRPRPSALANPLGPRGRRRYPPDRPPNDAG